MRIGILGGTFNPIHIGHLILAEEAYRQLSLDKIVFIPSYLPPHKERAGVIDARKRYQMTVLATKRNPCFSVSRVEIARQGKSYSVETLQEYKQRYKDKASLFFITGSDSLEEFCSWKDIDKMHELAQFVIASRPGYPLRDLPPGVCGITIPLIDISSSQIRKRIREGQSIRYLVPREAERYILKNGLYKG